MRQGQKESLHVLFVDDDEDEFILLKGLVSEQFIQLNQPLYDLEWADSFESALRAYSQVAYDVFLVDYHLGKENGLDLLRELNARGAKAPIILLTGQGSYEVDTAAMKAGASDYLVKDQLSAPLLERTIRYALEQKQAQEILEQRVQERTCELEKANQKLTQEINERKQVQEALYHSEQRFRTLADTTSAAIFIIQGFIIRYANPAARLITGLQIEDLLEHNFLDFVHPEYRAILRQRGPGNPWAEDIPARYELKIYKKDGQERWLDITAGRLDYEGSPAWILTAFDITERDLAEKELRKAKAELEIRVAERTTELQQANRQLSSKAAEAQRRAEELNAVFDAMAEAVVIYSADGTLLRANEVAIQTYGFNSVDSSTNDMIEALAIRFPDGESPHPEQMPVYRALHGETVRGMLLHITSPLQENLKIYATASPIYDLEGDIAGAVAIWHDVTERENLMAEHAALAIENARLYEAEAERVRELDALHSATAALVATIDLEPLLEQILDAVLRAIPAAEKSLLHLVSHNTGLLKVWAVSGGPEQDSVGAFHLVDASVKNYNFHKNRSYPAIAWRKRRSFLIADTSRKSNSLPSNGRSVGVEDARSLIVAPLAIEDSVLGTITVTSSLPGAFNEADLRLLNSFAATTTAALNNAQLHSEVQRLAVSDPLTEKYNRRGFFELGQREIDRGLRSGRSLSVIILDVDHFKEINDTYGHSAGDQVLRVLTERIASCVRHVDLIGRLGGDEFAVLLPETDLSRAVDIAGRIHQAVVEKPVKLESASIDLSISIGITEAPVGTSRLEDVLTRADTALYTAKQKGRNRIEQI